MYPVSSMHWNPHFLLTIKSSLKRPSKQKTMYTVFAQDTTAILRTRAVHKNSRIATFNHKFEFRGLSKLFCFFAKPLREYLFPEFIHVDTYSYRWRKPVEVHQWEENQYSSSLKRRKESQCPQRETFVGYQGQKEKQHLLEECINNLHRDKTQTRWQL